jgi:hypothetical protein
VLIVTICSNRGGTGKSTLTAGLATLAADAGLRVGMIDTALPAPQLHCFFGERVTRDTPSLASYLAGRCDIEQAARDVAPCARLAHPAGALLLVPASLDGAATADLLATGYDPGLLADACAQLADRHDLQVLFLDTHPGLSNESSLAVALADTVLGVAGPRVPDSGPPWPSVPVPPGRRRQEQLAVNQVPAGADPARLCRRFRAVAGVEPIALLRYRPEIAAGPMPARGIEPALRADLAAVLPRLIALP